MRNFLKRKKRDQKGQAAIEFIVVAVVIFFFLFLFMSLSFALIVSDYLEYATFMAARTYKSGYSTEGFQEFYAEQVFRRYADKVQGIARNFDVQFVQVDPTDEQTAGLVTSYDIDLFYLPPVFVSDGFPSAIRLTSEAHLGRDPSNTDCLNFFIDFNQRTGLNAPANLISQMADNGC